MATPGGCIYFWDWRPFISGTLADVSTYLKEHDPLIQCYLIDFPTSSLYDYITDGELKPCDDELGIGSDCFTANFKLSKVEDALVVSSEDVIRMSHHLQTEDLFVISSAARTLVGPVRARRLQRAGQHLNGHCDGAV